MKNFLVTLISTRGVLGWGGETLYANKFPVLVVFGFSPVFFFAFLCFH